MTSPYGPILTGVGLLEGGKLSKKGRQRYVEEVIGLLVTGNADGKGGTPATKIFNTLVPLPPIPGPEIFNVTTFAGEKLFWFEPDPLAATMATLLVDEKACPIWNKVFPDLLYAKTAAALDANGSTPLFPLFDVSVAFPDLEGFPITPPDLAVKANIMPPPKLLQKLADIGIELKVPSIPVPPIPPDIPNFLPPSLPGIEMPGLPSLALPDLLLGLIKMPFDLLLQLVLPPNIGLIMDLISLKFDAVVKLALDIVVKLLQPLIPIVPKLLIASILIYLKDIVAMVITDIVGMIIGAGGSLTKLVAAATGLI
jgi:hypothetical protein